MVDIWIFAHESHMRPAPLLLSLSRYGEYQQYNFNNPGFSDATGHFTQVSNCEGCCEALGGRIP
jgi:hypothetical protein